MLVWTRPARLCARIVEGGRVQHVPQGVHLVCGERCAVAGGRVGVGRDHDGNMVFRAQRIRRKLVVFLVIGAVGSLIAKLIIGDCGAPSPSYEYVVARAVAKVEDPRPVLHRVLRGPQFDGHRRVCGRQDVSAQTDVRVLMPPGAVQRDLTALRVVLPKTVALLPPTESARLLLKLQRWARAGLAPARHKIPPEIKVAPP